MNSIHRLVFNRATGVCQAVSEVATGSRGAATGATGMSAAAPRRKQLTTACLIALATLTGTSARAQDSFGTIIGSPGTDGAFSVGTGTNGTPGSAAVQATGSGSHFGALTGGSGGSGGPGIAGGGAGGSGGAGLASDVGNTVLFNAGTIAGGGGGAGGSGITRGAGGAGGTGVALAAPVTLINEGTVTGGLGGSPGGIGGAAVTATGGASVENGGTVRGGLSGDGLTRADAIRFTGDDNWLGLLSGSVIEGNVLASAADGDTLALSGNTNASFNASLIGPAAQYRNFAAFQKLGASTWTLTGATTAFTPWRIDAGTLAIASDASLGDVAGALTLNGGTLRTTADAASSRAMVLGARNGTLETDAGTSYTANGVVSGSGSLTKTGNGTATFTAGNSYTGGTAVLAGTLAGSATSFGSGAIVNNAALVIDQARDAALGNAMSGTGRFTKTGAGVLQLTGNSAPFAGSTQVAAGTLAVNGALGGALTVGNGATLAGAGTVGNTAVQSGATLAPGNGVGIGTLNVAGSITLAQGSVYLLDAASDGRSDQVRATGAATLQGGNVSVLASGSWSPTTSYVIVTADGGVSGRFGGASTSMAFLEPFLIYSPQTVTLRLQRNDVSFQDIAQTPNQAAAAGAVAGLRTGPLYSAVVQLGAADARSAFDSLSGEVHASLRSAAMEDSRFVRNASLGRLREAFDMPGAAVDAPAGSRGGVWAQGFDSWGSTDANRNASSADRTSRGLLLGADMRVGNDWRLGVLGGYSRSRVTLDKRASQASSDTYHAGVYGGRQWGALGLRAGATYSAGDIDTRRGIAFPGFSSLATANYDVRTTQVFGELGWRLPTPTGSLEPFVGLAHVKLRSDGFTETGGVAALGASQRTDNTSYSTLGLRGTSIASLAGVPASLRGLLGWRHALGDVDSTASLAFPGQPGFTVAGVPVAKNALVVEGGIDFAVKPNLTLGVSYTGQIGDSMGDHGIKATLLWKF